MEYLITNAGERMYGQKLHSIITVFTEKEGEVLLDSREDYEKIGTLLTKKFKKNPSYLNKLIAWSESQKNSLYDFINCNLNAKIIESLTNNQIAKRYKMYVKKYIFYHFKNTPAWWIAPPAVDKEIRRYFINNGIKDVDKIIATITEPLEYPTENFLEEVSMLNMAIGLKKIGIKFVNSANNLPNKLKKQFYAHITEFGSVPFAYKSGIVWEEKYFLDNLNKILKSNPLSTKNSKLKLIQKKIKKRDILLSSLHLPNFIFNLVISLRQVSYLQELKKATQTKSHPILQLVVNKEIAKRLGIEKSLIDYLSCDELVNFLNNGKIPQKIKNELKERSRFCVHIIKEHKRIWLLGKEAKKFIKINEIMNRTNEINEIKGIIASRGKTIGKVKICESSTEISKVKPGDILVVAMTTPDFVPAMKISAGIITNEGGIICHAAIISRELNKPCIIGTKIATKVLHDGDVVELDANNGIIKILKRIA
jgi:phosphoenolpyruvate synthase/pyruvate phosphate dikinase